MSDRYTKSGDTFAAAAIAPPPPRKPSLFNKCDRYFDPDGIFAQVKEADLYPYFRPVQKNDGTSAIMQGREIIMAGSNNYLGLLSDPRVKKAAEDAIEHYGTGCTGSRLSLEPGSKAGTLVEQSKMDLTTPASCGG